jgi:hypothetical protein
MRKWLIVVLVLLLPTDLVAAVLVFAGTFHLQASPQEGFSAGRTYLIYDIPTKSFTFHFYYRKDGKKEKNVRIQGAFDAVGNTSLPKGKTGTILTTGSVNLGAGNYSHRFLTLRGTNLPLTIQTSGPPIDFPRVLTGREEVVFVQGGSAFIETRFVLNYQQVLTKSANDAGDTYGQVLSSITQRLTAKGYQSLF